MKTQLKLDILGLSAKEKKVISCFLFCSNEKVKINTPLLINKKTKISRTAIYHILGVLKKRGLIERYKENSKFYYRMVSDEEIANKLYEIKRELNPFTASRSFPQGSNTESVLGGILPTGKVPKAEGVNLNGIVLHQGLPAIQACFTKMFTESKNSKFIGVQGNNTLPLYGEYLGKGFVDNLNRQIKDNKIISEGIMSEGWEATSKASFDVQWATHYTGRMANLHQIPTEYFQHQGEIFLFKDTLYLITLRELTIIEIRHGDISQSIAMLIKYIMDHTDTIDINRMVRELHGI